MDADFMAPLTHSAMRTSSTRDSNADEAEREDTAVEGPDEPTEGAAFSLTPVLCQGSPGFLIYSARGPARFPCHVTGACFAGAEIK